MEARQPGFEATDIRNRFDGPLSPDQLVQRLQQDREVARHNNEEATFKAQKDYHKKAEPHSFVRDQLVLLEDSYFAGRNAKLTPRFTGPYRIV